MPSMLRRDPGGHGPRLKEARTETEGDTAVPPRFERSSPSTSTCSRCVAGRALLRVRIRQPGAQRVGREGQDNLTYPVLAEPIEERSKGGVLSLGERPAETYPAKASHRLELSVTLPMLLRLLQRPFVPLAGFHDEIPLLGRQRRTAC